MDLYIKIFSIGFIDSITMGMSLATGIYVSKFSKEIIISSLIAETVGGIVSSSSSHYIGYEDLLSSIIIGISYALGSLIIILSYYYSDTTSEGFYKSIIYGLVSLTILSYYRSVYIGTSFTDSLTKTLFVGVATVLISYYISHTNKTTTNQI